MELSKILTNKELTTTEKRKTILAEMWQGRITIQQVIQITKELSQKDITILLESIEEISKMYPNKCSLEYLIFAQSCITLEFNSIKREAFRTIGNLAYLYPNQLGKAIEELLQNTTNENIIVREASAYALAKIVALPDYSKTVLVDIVSDIARRETQGSVKKQYLMGLKKANKLRK